MRAFADCSFVQIREGHYVDFCELEDGAAPLPDE